ARRVLINPAVCEGCGDCGVQSNCLSVEPLQTEFGRKRQINQSSCNKDFSCLKGFCPSFVTVEGGRPRKAAPGGALPAPESLGELPEPNLPACDNSPGGVYGLVVAGVGGTGVITIGQLLGVAAHLEDKGVVTQDAAGLAQKGGATWSHVLLAEQQAQICTTRVGTAAADLILGCDAIVAAGKESLARLCPGRTRVALNGHVGPTAAFVHQPDWQNPAAQCQATLERVLGKDAVALLDAEALATRLLGDALYINPLLLGFAWQKGWLPLRRESLRRAIELNAVAVAKNQAAFEWGRWAAHDGARLQALLAPAQAIALLPRTGLEALLQRRSDFLRAYQDDAYAQRYSGFVRRVQQAEAAALGPKQSALTEAVAHNLFKLMAYKDEYEVARLHSEPEFLRQIGAQFEGDFALRFHLAPPLWARHDER
ncbi:MAG: 2-oxoacid:acceptor oxidoreductase family protein, partial [Serpentinimonas sp.]|nr:2-oxoacid:acceptor oxidoreductase family protein [Serpentinimonas sp.]